MRAAFRFLMHYRVSLIAPALATLFSILLWPVSQRLPFALFIAAVIVSTWQGGQKTGLLTTALSAFILAIVYWLQVPDNKIDTPGEYILRLGMFVLVGVLAGYLCQQCKKAIAAADHVHDVLSSSGFALIFTDADGKVTHVNPQAESLTGWKQNDARETPLERVFSLVHGDTLKPIPNPAADVFRQRAAQDLADDTVLLAASGARIPIEGTAGPMRDAGDRVVGVVLAFRDASRRKKTDRDQRARAERFEALAAHAPLGMLVLDKAGRCVYANASCQTACGCSADESTGEGWTRHLLPEDRTRLVADWTAAVETKQSYIDEFRIQVPDRAARWLQLQAAPMLSDTGEILGHVGILEDVSTQKQAEAAWQEARTALTRKAEESSAGQKKAEEALQKTRADLAKLTEERSANQKQAEESLRQSRDSLQKQIQELTASQKRAEESFRTTRQQLERQVQELEQQIKEKTAAQKRAEEALAKAREDFERQAQSQQKQPEVSQKQLEERLRKEQEKYATQVEELKAAHKTALAALQTELTRHQETGNALRQSQERLQTLVEGIPALVSLKNREGRYLLVNRAFAAFVKRSAEHVVGKKAADLLTKDSAVFTETVERKVLESGTPQSVEEEVSSEQGLRTYLTSKFPLQDAAGERFAVGSVSVDITERKQAEEKLRRENELLAKQAERNGEEVLVPVGARDGNARPPSTVSRPAAKGYTTPDFRKDDGDWLAYN